MKLSNAGYEDHRLQTPKRMKESNYITMLMDIPGVISFRWIQIDADVIYPENFPVRINEMYRAEVKVWHYTFKGELVFNTDDFKHIYETLNRLLCP